jgi:signal transduction histidine kinase
MTMKGASEDKGQAGVLIIDDNEKLLALAELALNKHGVRVETASTVTAWFANLREFPADLVIFDDLDHDLRTPMTIVRGEVELVLSQEDTPSTERGRSSAAIIERIEKLETLLLRRYRT